MIDPLFDSLLGHPSFETLLEEYDAEWLVVSAEVPITKPD